MSKTKQPTFKKIILDDLKQQGLSNIVAKIKSITYETFSMGDAVRVEAWDLTKSEREKLNEILKEYQHGYFDGMNDIYEYTDSKKPRSAKYVTLSANYTAEAKAAAKAQLLHKYGVKENDDQESRRLFNCWYDQAVHQELYKIESFEKVGA